MMGGRGSSNPRSGGNNAGVGATVKKTLYSKSQVGELTASYTPSQFLGDTSLWSGSVNSAKDLAEDNMPKSLEVGGYTFNSLGSPDARFVSDGKLKNNVVVMMDYQSSEKIGNEYPVLQVGVSIRRYRGKIKTEIIRDNPLYGTKFW